MPKERAEASAERLADHFTNYLFRKYQRRLHVRRVASWVGLIVLGIDKIAAERPTVPRVRQLEFCYGKRNFKARYNHKAGKRGGIDIVEVLPGQGSPDGDVILSITNLREAEDFYNKGAALLRRGS